MKRTDLLSSFYNSELLPILNKLDAERRGLLYQLVGACILLVALFIGVGYYVTTKVEKEMMAFFLLPLLIFSVFGFYMLFEAIFKNTSYYADYKREVIHRLVSLINPALHYDKKHHISHHEYDNSGFFAHEAVDIYGDDHVSGTINGVRVEFSEFAARYKHQSDRKRFDNEYQFRGIFFVAEKDTIYPADLVIEPRKDNNGDAIILPMDHEEFSSLFQVRLPNNDFRRQAENWLTTQFMDEVVAFKRHMHNPLIISFKYNKMYVGIVHDKDLLEPSLFSSVARWDHIQLHFNDLYVPINIIEHFAANLEADALQDDVMSAQSQEA